MTRRPNVRRVRNAPLDQDPAAITRVRRDVGLSQAELAEAVGISSTLMCDIEHGRRNASPPMLRQFAEILGCERAELEHKADDEAAVA